MQMEEILKFKVMKYYIAKGPIKETGYKWDVSYYEVDNDMSTKAIRIFPDGFIKIDHIFKLSKFFIEKHCKEITEEEYNLILEL